MRLLLLLVIGGLMHAARSFAPQPGVGSEPGGVALACGYLLLSAFLAGSLVKAIGLPKLTGYIATGIIVGPQVLDLVSHSMVDELRIFNGVAIALIALTAGTEMEFRSMRPLFRTIGWITGVAVIGTTLMLSGLVYLCRGLLPFMSELTLIQAVAVSVVLGVVMVAQSPAVVVALRDETDADGPVSRTVLGVVVISDLVVIVLFALVSTATKALFGADSDAVQTAGMLTWEIFGSGIAGAMVAALLAVYLRKVRGGGALFVVTVAFVVAEVGQRIHFDPLIVALTAGILIRNLTEMGERLHHEIEAASLPVYVAFFAVTGATIHLDALMVVGLPAALFVVVRGAGLLTGTRIATQMAGAPDSVKRFAGFGLLPQAGLALALALLFTRAFPTFGREASALVLSVVAINEIVAPVLYRLALIRSGEAGQRSNEKAKMSAGEDIVGCTT